MHFKIQRAKQKDRCGINRLIRKARLGSLVAEKEIKNFWIVLYQGEIIACAGLDFFGDDVAIFTHLVVAEEFRKQGIGSALINERVKVAEERGKKILAFVTMYYRFRFYKKWGFKTCPRKFLPESIKNYWMFTIKRYKKCAIMFKYI